MKEKLFFLAIILIVACQNEKNSVIEEPVEVTWSLDSVATALESTSYVSFKIKNNSDQTLAPEDWSLHYSQLALKTDTNRPPEAAKFKNPTGDYWIMAPTTAFGNLNPGESKTIPYVINGIVDKMSLVPKGVFAVIDDHPTGILSAQITGINEETLKSTNPTTALTRYEEFKNLKTVDKSELQPFFPSPAQYASLPGSLKLEREIRIALPKLEQDITPILYQHEKWLNCKFTTSDFENSQIKALIISDNNANPESYKLKIDEDGILIEAPSSVGIFYAVQSVMQLLYTNQKDGPFEIPLLEVSDAPRFDYRGMMLDVSRNFQSIAEVKKIIDMMSFFKLNNFHFHLTDDEGWRLEIPDLPELTNIGAKRGFTADEKDRLYPAWGSGPDSKSTHGSGYFTTEEFIDILKYAQQRYINVVPEIDVPGHSRAAIIAMSTRYDRYMESGDEEKAKEYLLHDHNDQSEYTSAQGHSDNTICVCQDGAYNFMKKVMSEVIQMYKKVNVKLETIHVGGDEIPAGVWEKSPICQEFIAQHPDLKKTGDLQAYFFNIVKDYLTSNNIQMAGWEEILLEKDEHSHNTTAINHDQIDSQTIPYVWNAVWGWGREDMVYKLANAGSPVILCNSAAFYLDMSYDRDPNETGLSWSGFAGTKEAFALDPLDIFKTARLDRFGNPLDPEYVANKERLTDKGKSNFMGIQAQLWGETIGDKKWLDYLMYPKMFGFAERAWSPAGDWMQYDSPEKVDEAFENGWNKFANAIGQKGLPMLDQMYDGIGYRKPKVGIGPNGEEAIQFPGYEVDDYKSDMVKKGQ